MADSVSVETLDEANRGRVGKNFAYLAAGELVNKGLRFLATIVFARALTVSDFGLVNVVIAASGIAFFATTLGLNDLGSREVAVSPRNAGWLAGRVIQTRAAVLLAVIAVSAVIAAVLAPDTTHFVVLAGLMALCMTTSADWIARALERMDVVAASAISGGLVLVAGAVAVAATGSPTAEAALVVFVLAEAAVAAVTWIVIGRYARPAFGFSGVRKLVRRSWPLGVSALVNYAYFANVDTIILAAARSTDEAGVYSAAYRLFLTFNAIPIFVAYAFLPVLARGVTAGVEHVTTARLLRALALLAWFGIAVVGVVEVAGGAILRTVFGSEFEPAAATFVVLCVALAWFSVGFPAGYSLIAEDRNRSYLAGAVTAGVVNLALNFILIPDFGMMGAAIATVAAFVTATFVWLKLRRVLGRGLLLSVIALSVVSVAAFVAAGYDEVRTGIGVATLAVAGSVSIALLRRMRRQAVAR